MLRIAIVDDEMAEIQKLQELVEQFFREKQVAYQITSYISGETFLVAQQQCDLIFLDVQMTGIDGIATARNIRQNDRKAALIYVSNFSEKMADSFAVHPFAFLEKPVMREKLWMHLQDYLDYYESQPVCQNDALTLKGEHGSLIVRVQDILYLEYAGNRKVQIHLKQDEKTVYGSITKFLQLLEPFHFISPHKSYIIKPQTDSVGLPAGHYFDQPGQNPHCAKAPETNRGANQRLPASALKGESPMNLFMDVFLNICTLLSGYLALWKLLDKREMPNRFLWNCAKWGYVLLAAFLQALVSQLHIPWLNLVTIAISFVGMTKLFFRCNLVPLLLYDTAVMVCLFAADMVSSLAVSVSLGDSVSETLQRTDVLLARYLLCIILCFMLCSIFPLFFKRRELYEIYWYEVIAYGLLAAFEITSAAYIVHRLQFFSSGLFVILFTMGCLVLDIYLVFVFYQLAESRKREKEYSLIQQQSNIQLSVYRELSQKYADSVRIAHDAKKHVRALEDLVQSEQASQYRDSICAELNKLYPAFEHENPLFSVLINHALYRSERNGIRLDLRLHDADLSMLSDMDLTILFANLLDNAIEACTSLPAEKRKIQLILEQEMGFLIIHITNPFAELAPLPHHKYGSTKPGHMGVGLSNVRQTVEKYHGVFSVDTDAEVFAVAITIPVAQK